MFLNHNSCKMSWWDLAQRKYQKTHKPGVELQVTNLCLKIMLLHCTSLAWHCRFCFSTNAGHSGHLQKQNLNGIFHFCTEIFAHYFNVLLITWYKQKMKEQTKCCNIILWQFIPKLVAMYLSCPFYQDLATPNYLKQKIELILISIMSNRKHLYFQFHSQVTYQIWTIRMTVGIDSINCNMRQSSI
jgi:hypothetical protein